MNALFFGFVGLGLCAMCVILAEYHYSVRNRWLMGVMVACALANFTFAAMEFYRWSKS